MGAGCPSHWTLAARLEFHSQPEPNSGCVLWRGAVGTTGYGNLTYRQQSKHAHQWAWIERHGPVPEDLELRHKCDVRACINVDHLETGTHSENMQDSVRRNRCSRLSKPGEENGSAILTTEQVLLIRRSKETTAALARRYGVAWSTIKFVRIGKTWSHLTDNCVSGP